MKLLSALLVASFCILSGCGYSRSGDEPSGNYQWRSLYREDGVSPPEIS